MSGAGEKGKQVMRQEDSAVVKAILEENLPFDTILNQLICLSNLTALTFGGFLEMSLQSALSALSNDSNYELLLSDKTQVLHKIFNSCLSQVLICPNFRHGYEGWVREVVLVLIAYTKKCSPAGLGYIMKVRTLKKH